MNVILAALISAIVWNILTWFLGIPSSSSHALIGGMVGAVVVGAGWSAIQMGGLEKVLIALFASPVIGLLGGYVLTKLVFFLAQSATPRINWFFRRSQIITAIALAFSHGTNDAQKTMGIITLGLVISGQLNTFEVPLWVIAASASAIALGTALGGWRLIKTSGGQVLQDQAGTRLLFANYLGAGHPGGLAAWWPGEHHPGGQLGDYGRRLGAASQHGALGGGGGDRRGVAGHHPGYRVACSGHILDNCTVISHLRNACSCSKSFRSCSLIFWGICTCTVA